MAVFENLFHIDGLAQDWTISSALAMEKLQSGIKPFIWLIFF